MLNRFTLAATVETQLVEKKSRFLTRLHPVADVEEADARLRAARRDHPSARHHCTALVIDDDPGGTAPVHRSSDDGEPAGTAGMPMLQVLLHAQLVDTLAIVIRYFGGVKLGAGGLLRAYTAGVEQAVSAATLLRRTEMVKASIEVPPAEAGMAENAVRLWATAHGATIEPTDYDALGARLHVLLEPEMWQALTADVAAWSQGRYSPVDAGRNTRDIPL